MAASFEPLLVAVVAMARNRVIGLDGRMPWRLPTDLRHFKETTLGRPMIMGRKTLRSIGKALDGRDTIVLTRAGGIDMPGVLVAGGIEAALDLAREKARSRGTNEIVIAGGAEIYRAFMPRIHRVELTVVDAEPEGDTWFPLFETKGFERLLSRTPERNPGDSAACRFETWERVGAGPARGEA